MSLSKSQRVRYLFQTQAGYHQFCWIEQRGNDLYVGSPSSETIEGATAELLGQSAQLTVPEVIKKVEGEATYASFHASGRFHIWRGGKPQGSPMRWPRKEEIKAPYRIATLISKHPKLYPLYPRNRSLTRNKTSAFVIRVTKKEETTRHYFEFFVSPAGRFTVPPPLLSITSSNYTEPKPITFSLNEQLILVTRHLVLNGLGFANRRLYLMPEFFRNKPTERLVGAGISPEHLNDALGKALWIRFTPSSSPSSTV